MSQLDDLHFSFPSHVLLDPTIADGYMKHYVPIPMAIADALTEAGYQHVEGRLNGHAFRRVIHTRPDGTPCLKFGMTWLKQAKLDVDMEIDVELEPDLDPNRVDLPDELEAALRADPRVEDAWEELSPSRRKTLAYGVARAKQTATRQRRAKAIIDDLRNAIGIAED